MPRDPLPWYKWYPKDFRASRRVQKLTYIARGLYRDLLDEVFLKGFIPDDPEELADICLCPPDVMKQAWPDLRKCFTKAQMETQSGALTNERMARIIAEQEQLRDDQSEKGKRSAAVRQQRSTGAEQRSTSRVDKSREEKSTEDKNNQHVENSILDLAVAGSIPKEDTVGPLVEAGWRYFLERTSRHADQYKLTPERRTMGRRGIELLLAFAKQRNHPEPSSAAVELFQIAVDRMVSSPFHAGQNDRGRQYLDWHHLFTGKGYPSPRKLLEFWLDDARWPA